MDAATRNHLRFRRSEIVLAREGEPKQIGRPEIDFEQEVEQAVAEYRRMLEAQHPNAQRSQRAVGLVRIELPVWAR